MTTADYYFYLNQSATFTVEDVSDKKDFAETMVRPSACHVDLIG